MVLQFPANLDRYYFTLSKSSQEVKNLLRGQCKYGLMGSSAKTGKKFFCGSQEQFLDKTVIWDRTPLAIHQMQCICVGVGSRVPNLQKEFNYLNSFKSYCIFSDFVVPTSSLSSPHRPHVVPVIPTSSPCHPYHPPLSRPHSTQKVPMWSPWLWSLWSPWSPPHVVPIVPVVPTSSPLSSCHPCHPHIIPMSFRRSPHHPQPPRYPLHPGGWGPQISKNAIRFELIKIF